jgi:hypothetical protein
MTTVELVMMNAAPDGSMRLLQSNTVADGTPLIINDAMPLMLTVESLKKPAAKLMLAGALLLTLSTAYATDLHALSVPQPCTSTPVRGSTLIEAAAAGVAALARNTHVSNAVNDLTHKSRLELRVAGKVECARCECRFVRSMPPVFKFGQLQALRRIKKQIRRKGNFQ